MLNEVQRETLQAVCDTVVPSIERADDAHGVWARKASDLGVRPDARGHIRADAPRAAGGDAPAPRRPRRPAVRPVLTALARAGPAQRLPRSATQAAAGVGALVGLTLFLQLRRARPGDGPEPELGRLRLPGPDRGTGSGRASRSSRWCPTTATLELEADVCIVGSGAGGGVIAGTLAGQGLKVVVLEAGGYFDESDFNQLELWAYQNLYWRGGPQPTADLNVTLQAGASLGGGTAINWTNCLRTHAVGARGVGRGVGLEGLDGPDFDRHLDAVLSAHLRHRSVLGAERTAAEDAGGCGAAWLVLRGRSFATPTKTTYSPETAGVHGLRRPVGLQAEHAEDLPARRRRQRRRHRGPLLRRADPRRGRPRRRRRGERTRIRETGRTARGHRRARRAWSSPRERWSRRRCCCAPGSAGPAAGKYLRLHPVHGRVRRSTARTCRRGGARRTPACATSSRTSRTATAS